MKTRAHTLNHPPRQARELERGLPLQGSGGGGGRHPHRPHYCEEPMRNGVERGEGIGDKVRLG